MDDFPETTAFYRMRLPHWEVVGGRYFVTMRVNGSIPNESLEHIKKIRAELDDSYTFGG